MSDSATTRDWKALGFGYVETPYRFQAEWADGEWSEGGLVEESTVTVAEGACGLHYGQQCFEGLKAHAGPDGRAYVFRPDQNAARMARTAERLLMAPPPEELFLRAVTDAVNSAKEFMICKQLIGKAVDVEALANDETDLKTLL